MVSHTAMRAALFFLVFGFHIVVILYTLTFSSPFKVGSISMDSHIGSCGRLGRGDCKGDNCVSNGDKIPLFCCVVFEVANGEVLESEGIGVVDLPLIQWNGKTTLLRLKNVVYAPQLKANLLSADQLNRENMGISLLPINSEIIDLQNKKRLGTICRLNNLYIVNTGHMRSGGQHSYLVEAKPKSIRLWHRRLGHLGLKNVQKLENLVRGMKISEKQKDDHDFVCGHCQKSKTLKTPLQILRH